jgi:hypothetical protein
VGDKSVVNAGRGPRFEGMGSVVASEALESSYSHTSSKLREQTNTSPQPHLADLAQLSSHAAMHRS